MKKYDVCALGELLVDFTDSGRSGSGNPVMEANPGGAPCNVLAMLAKQGYKTAFIGKVGNDMFGKMLADEAEKAGISMEGLVKDKNINTTLAFVHNMSDGDRDFSFYRNPGADMMLTEDDVDTKLIRESRIFHFGSLSMTNETSEAATKKAVITAEENGLMISFDPNLRENLWDSLKKAREKISYGFSHCKILKISDDEIQWFTGESDPDRAAEALISEYGIPLVFLTMGSRGSAAYTGGRKVYCSASVTAVTDTTGAGDVFFGAALGKILEYGFREYTDEELAGILKFANTAAGIVTERKGALKSVPGPDEIAMRISSESSEQLQDGIYGDDEENTGITGKRKKALSVIIPVFAVLLAAELFAMNGCRDRSTDSKNKTVNEPAVTWNIESIVTQEAKYTNYAIKELDTPDSKRYAYPAAVPDWEYTEKEVSCDAVLNLVKDQTFKMKLSDLIEPGGIIDSVTFYFRSADGSNTGQVKYGTGISVNPECPGKTSEDWYQAPDESTVESDADTAAAVWQLPDEIKEYTDVLNGYVLFGYWWGDCDEIVIEKVTCSSRIPV